MLKKKIVFTVLIFAFLAMLASLSFAAKTAVKAKNPWVDAVMDQGVIYGNFPYDTTLKNAFDEVSKATGLNIESEEDLDKVKMKEVVIWERNPEETMGMILVNFNTTYWYQRIGENSYNIAKLEKIKANLTKIEKAELEEKLDILKRNISKDKQKFLTQPKVTQIFTETDLRDALNTIACDCKINIFMDQTIRGPITCEFENIPLEVVLNKILVPSGFCFKKRGRDYVAGTASSDSASFQELSTTEVVKPDYIPAKEIVDGCLSDFFKPFVRVNEKRNTITITGSPQMVKRIREDIQKLDAPLKKIEIRLATLEYSRQKKSEINLESLDAFLGKGSLKREIFGVNIGDQTFGASSEDELKSILKLRVLSDLNEIEFTGDQRATLLEGEIAKIFLTKEGDIFITPPNGNWYSLQKETVKAEQGVEVKVVRVTKDNEILLNIQGKLEDIKDDNAVTKTGQAVWIDKRSIDTTVPIKNYQTITIGTLTRKMDQKGKGITSKLDNRQDAEIIFMLTANVVGTEKPQEVEFDSKVAKFFERPEKKKERKIWLGVYSGVWSSDSIKEGLVVYDGELKLWDVKLFGGGGSNQNSWVNYGGVKYSIGDILNLGAGGFDSYQLDKMRLMYTAGISLGTERFRLSADYFYVPENKEVSGVKASIGLRF